MTPRELGSGAIRNLPGTPPAERPQHGPITGLVRKDRCGCVAYEGLCDGQPVCIVELSAGVWRARTRDAVLGEGPLVELLGVRVGDEWLRLPHNELWPIVAVHGDEIRFQVGASWIRGLVEQFLEYGWRPVST